MHMGNVIRSLEVQYAVTALSMLPARDVFIVIGKVGEVQVVPDYPLWLIGHSRLIYIPRYLPPSSKRHLGTADAEE